MCCSQLLCDHTAHHIQLVRACYGNKQIGVFNAGLTLYAMTCAVSRNAHHIVLTHHAVDQYGVFVNDGYAVSFACNVLDESISDLSVAYDHNSHKYMHLFISYFRNIGQCPFYSSLYHILSKKQEGALIGIPTS